MMPTYLLVDTIKNPRLRRYNAKILLCFRDSLYTHKYETGILRIHMLCFSD